VSRVQQALIVGAARADEHHHLAAHHEHREVPELGAALRVPAVDRLPQPDPRGLEQVAVLAVGQKEAATDQVYERLVQLEHGPFGVAVTKPCSADQLAFADRRSQTPAWGMLAPRWACPEIQL
jgi:hypothetical protein